MGFYSWWELAYRLSQNFLCKEGDKIKKQMIIVDILYPVVKNPPAKAGDAVSIPGLGRP